MLKGHTLTIRSYMVDETHHIVEKYIASLFLHLSAGKGKCKDSLQACAQSHLLPISPYLHRHSVAGGQGGPQPAQVIR